MSQAFDVLFTTTAQLKNKSTSVYQQQFDRIFRALSRNLIDRQDYRYLCNQLFTMLPHFLPETKSLKHRINRKCDGSDVRTCGEFALEIYDGVQREKTIINAWIDHMIKSGHMTKCGLQDNGMDNTGCVQYERTNVNSNPDFILDIEECPMFPQKMKLEVKINTWGTAKATFKVHNLEEYLKQNASLLMIWLEQPESSWTIITPEQIKQLLTLPKEPRREMGGMCECVQILEQDYPKYFNKLETLSLRL